MPNIGLHRTSMTKRAYKLAALFFFILGVASILAAVSMGIDQVFNSGYTRFYFRVGIMGLLAAGAVRFGASRKT